MAVKDAYSTKELAALLGLVISSVTRKAVSEGWQSRPRPGRGGGNEWLVASMPECTQVAIRTAEERAAVAAMPVVPEVLPAYTPDPLSSPAILDDKRRYHALAKGDLLRLYLDWQRKHGTTTAQKDAFIWAYNGGAWPKIRAELGEVSWKSLERWKLEQKRAGSVLALVEKYGLAHRGRTQLTNQHKTIILGHILNPTAPAVSQAIREVQKRCVAESIFEPSEPTIRRFVKKYMKECYDEWVLWREGKKAWNDKCAISLLRDWNLVGVGDIVIADGHTLNFETINPDTGKPCRMTLLLFFDGASNHPLGWEIMPSENTACIAAAFRRTCIVLGKFPRVVYLDNGRAFRAKFFKGCANFEEAGFGGLYRDLGCEVIHAWPYHGQSKPVERFFGTMHDLEVWMPSYTGYDIAHKPARMMRGETLHRKLYDKLGCRPLTLEETHTQVARWFDEYANRPQARTHLNGQTPAQVFHAGRGTGLTTEQAEKLTLFMMQKEIRTITKDGIKVNGRLYWHEALASRRHPVLVRYDEWSPYSVLVYTLEGEWLCEALDREHHHIAYGLHPAARLLGTPEQRAELEAAIALKKGQERESSASMQHMLELCVRPETQDRYAAIETAAPEAVEAAAHPAPAPRKAAPALSQAEIEAVERAKAQARAALDTVQPTYIPSTFKRFRDEIERYAYLFGIRWEQGIELTPEDAAWMEQFETTPLYQRNLKGRYDAFREMYRARKTA